MKIVIIGASENGHGKACLHVCNESGTGEAVGFVDDNPSLHGKKICGLPVLGGCDTLPELRADGVDGAFIGIGDNAIRRRLFRQVMDAGFDTPNLIHPTAYIGSDVALGRGIFIGVNAVLIAGVSVGDFALINTAASIDHDCRIGEAVFVGPGVHLASNVTVEEEAFVGIGAVCIQNTMIGERAVVGAGAVVIRDVLPHTTCVGVPAAPMQRSSPRVAIVNER